MTAPGRQRLRIVAPGERSAYPKLGMHAGRALSQVAARLASALNTVAAWFEPVEVCGHCRLVDVEPGVECPRCGKVAGQLPGTGHGPRLSGR